MRKLLRKLKHYLIPHRRNRFRPGIFTKQSVATLVLCLMLIEGIYLFQIHVVLKNDGFLAAVFPAAITSLTNADRSAQGLGLLTEDPLLAQAAQAKADDMAAKGYFSHVSPDGKTPWYWLDSVKYPYSYAGENLAVDFSDSKDVETAWMNSPMHRANILKSQYTRIGVGIAQGTYQGHSTTFVVQFFATRSGDATGATQPAESTPDVAKVPATEIASTRTPAPTVLGSETTLKPKPSSVVVAKPSDSASQTVDPAPSTAATVAPSAGVAIAATSPSHFMLYLLSALTGFFLVILLITLVAHVRRRFVYLEVLSGGFVLVGVLVLMLVYDRGTIPTVPNAAESASAAIAL